MKPCPGEVALQSDGTCPAFECDATSCKNAGTCETNGKCSCNNGFSGVDCTLGKIIQHRSVFQMFLASLLVLLAEALPTGFHLTNFSDTYFASLSTKECSKFRKVGKIDTKTCPFRP